MGAYDDTEDLPPLLRPHRGVTVALVVLLTVVLVGVVGVFLYALSPLGDPSAGSMPPPGSDRELVHELVPALDDEAAIARLVPANAATENARLRDDCGQVAGDDPDITIVDGITPSAFRVVIEGTAEPTAGPSCWISFQWIEGEGWHATSTTP